MTFAVFLVLLRSLCGTTAVTAPASGNATLLCFQADPTQFRIDFSTTPPTLHTITPSSTIPVFVTGEIPAGTLNGINATFTLANVPTAGSEAIWLNGLRMKTGFDYTISGATITFVPADIAALQSGVPLLADYRH